MFDCFLTYLKNTFWGSFYSEIKAVSATVTDMIAKRTIRDRLLTSQRRQRRTRRNTVKPHAARRGVNARSPGGARLPGTDGAATRSELVVIISSTRALAFGCSVRCWILPGAGTSRTSSTDLRARPDTASVSTLLMHQVRSLELASASRGEQDRSKRRATRASRQRSSGRTAHRDPAHADPSQSTRVPLCDGPVSARARRMRIRGLTVSSRKRDAHETRFGFPARGLL